MYKVWRIYKLISGFKGWTGHEWNLEVCWSLLSNRESVKSTCRILFPRVNFGTLESDKDHQPVDTQYLAINLTSFKVLRHDRYFFSVSRISLATWYLFSKSMKKVDKLAKSTDKLVISYKRLYSLWRSVSHLLLHNSKTSLVLRGHKKYT